jgi:hypothetical protein
MVPDPAYTCYGILALGKRHHQDCSYLGAALGTFDFQVTAG